MTELLYSIILAIVQGITEWIPVSSSGHLVFLQNIFDYNPGLVFDAALHFGTLMAVFVYFGRDIVNIIEDLIRGRFESENGRTGLMLIVATIPAGAIGFLFNNIFEQAFNELILSALGFAVTALFLFIASMDFGKGNKEVPNYIESFLIGVTQAFSIIPGISRSGATLSSGVLLGLKEKSALRFSFLMSIPIIFGANVLEIGSTRLAPNLIWATLVSFGFGLFVLHLLYNFILTTKKNLRWFAGYALLLSIATGTYLLFT